jgi:phage head maturation protease
MKIYAEISKTEKQDDGTIKVWGYASSEAVDSDGEVITADAMKAALPDYMKFGAVREMHQPLAAGTAIEAKVEDDGRTYFGAHVVDPIAVKKVETGVYKGFSIGGKVTARDDLNKSIIKGLKLVEVSLVDRPANPEAVFTCYKAETADDEPAAIDVLAEMLNKGEISPERLIELAKADKNEPSPQQQAAPDDPPANAGGEGAGDADAAKASAGGEVEKGLYGVARFASLLADVQYLAEDTAWEAEYEGDDSALPGKIKAWLGTGLKLLAAMVKEEAAEALADKADDSGDVQKAADADDGALAKVSAELDLVKAEVAKLTGERDAFEKRVKELEAQPAPGKALLKAIEKGQDVGQTEVAKTDDPAPDEQAAPEDVALAQIRKMYQSGGIRVG